MIKSLRLKTINDLRVNRGQFLAVWIVVMLGVAFYGAMYPAGVMLLRSIEKTETSLNAMDFQVKFDTTYGSALTDSVTGINGVSAAEERLVIDAGWQPDPDSVHRITLRLVSLPDERQPEVNQNEIIDGHPIEAEDEILVLKAFADHHDINVGDTLKVEFDGEFTEWTVAGTVFNPEYMIAGRSATSPFPTPSTFGVAWLRYTPLADFAGMQMQVNQVVIRTDDAIDEGALRADLNAAFVDLENVQVLAANQTPSGGMVQALINGNFPIMEFFSGVFLIGSVVMTAILLGRLVQGERRRIGTLRAMGITRQELVLHYLSFGILIGVTGGLVGMVVGYLNSLWVSTVFIELIIGGTLPEFSYAPQIGFLSVGFAVAVIGSTLAGMYPAWVESGTPPGVALRPATPTTPNKLSQLTLSFLPMAARRAIRNILRTPGRAISTVLGVILGAMMIFSAYAMWDSLEKGTSDFFDASAYDLSVNYQQDIPQLASVVQRNISEIEGVTGVETALVGPVTVIAADTEFDTIGITGSGTDSYIDLNIVDGEPAFSRDDGVWIGHNLARILDIGVGDTIMVEVVGQRRETTILGVVSYLVGAPLYITDTTMTEMLLGNIPLANTALVRAEKDQLEAVRDAVVTLPGVTAVEVLSEWDSDMDTYLLFFRVGTLIFGGFGYVLTLAVLFNTVNAGMSERIGELSIVRALGNSGREIAAIVLLELLLLTIIGAIIGTPIGRMVGFDLMQAYDTDLFSNLNTMTVVSLILGWVSLLLIVGVATLPGLQMVQRMDLGAVSKSQSI